MRTETCLSLFLRVFGLCALSLCTLCIAPSVGAQAAYTYQGNPFNSFTFLTCPPWCQISGSFTVPSPLPANFSGVVVPTLFSFTDGVDLFTTANPNGASYFHIVTNSNGNVVQWLIQFGITAGPGAGLYQTENDNSAVIDLINLGGFSGEGASISNSPGTWLSSLTLRITTTSIPPAEVGKEYRFCFQATGSSPPGAIDTWKISFASPTPGFSNSVPPDYFSSTGCLDSIPEKDGNFPFSLTVSDPSGDVSAPAFFTLHVAATTAAKAADSRLANAYTSFCLAGLPGNTPTSVGEAVGAGAQDAAICALAIKFAQSASDPPDPNFTSIAQPVPFPVVLPSTDWPPRVSNAFRALLEDQANLFGLAQAALTATERAQGAQAAGDVYWTTRQSQAAAQFDELMTWRMAEYSPISSLFETAYTRAGLPDILITPAEISALSADLPDLPPSLASALAADGFTSEDIAVLTGLLAANDVPTANVSLFMLQDQLAVVLSAEAPNLSPVAAVKTAITDSNIADGIRFSLAAKLYLAEAGIGRGEFDDACRALTAIGLQANAQRGIGIPPAQDDAIVAALATTTQFCPARK
jgi:hypothetical protein